MERDKKVILVLVTSTFILWIISLRQTSPVNLSRKTLNSGNVFEVVQHTSNESFSLHRNFYKVLNQRNELSKSLNRMRMQFGRLQCEGRRGKTNEIGGYCKSASTENGGEHVTDMELVRALSKFLTGKSVASFGDGPGAYKREILKLGEVTRYDAYDGAPYCNETSGGRVTFLDLTVPQYGLPTYDWIISLEVAEHIPIKYESTYLDNIFRHAKEGIIISWAVPGQAGLRHINNRPLEYVIKVMKESGFYIDMRKSKILQDGAERLHLKRNTHVYIRSEELNSNYSIFA